MKKLYAILAATSLYACSPDVSYVGQRYAPVSDVKVFVDEKAIDRPYTVIGRGYAQTAGTWPATRLQERLMAKYVAKAKQNGADAVLFRDMIWLYNGTSIYTNSRTDSLPRAVITTSNTQIGPINNRETEVLFLKFK